MAEELPLEVRDPFVRRLADLNSQAQAQSGQFATPKLFETEAERTKFQQDIIGASEARLGSRIQNINATARSQGRLQSGLTSFEEQQELLRTRAEETATFAELGQREREDAAKFARDRILAREQQLSGLATERVAGEEQRRTQGLIGQQAIEQIGARGVEDRRLQEMVNAGQISVAEAQGLQQRITQGLIGAQELEQIAARGREDRLTQEPVLQQQREVATGAIRQTQPLTQAELQTLVRGNTQLAANAIRALGGNPTGLTPDQIAQSLFQLQGLGSANVDAIRRELGIATAPTVEAQRLTTVEQKQVSIQDRLAAVEEGRLTREDARIAIEEGRLQLANREQRFNEKATEAQLTGIWEKYGAEEVGNFIDSFGSNRGSKEYRAEFDFNDDGIIDFSDHIQFAKYVELGGIPTLQLQNFREDTRQFDVSSAEGIRQWEKSFTEMTRQYRLSNNQTYELAILQMQNNLAITESQVDVGEMAAFVDLMNGPAGQALTDSDINNILDAILDSGSAKTELATNLGHSYQDMEIRADEAFFGIIQGEAGITTSGPGQVLAYYDQLATMYNRQDPQTQQRLLTRFDVNQDGLIDAKDAYLVMVMSGG